MATRISIYALLAYSIIENKNDEKIGYGGAELNLVNLAVELAKDPLYRIDMYVADHGSEMLKTFEGINIRRLMFFDYQKYRGPIYKIIRVLVLNYALLKDRSSCLITSCANEMIGYMRLTAIFRRRIILLRMAHEHDLDFDFLQQNYSPRFVKLYKFGLEAVDAFIAQNSFQYQKLLEMYPDKTVQIIKNAFQIKIDENRSVPRDIILWIARCADFKRPELFVELAARVERFHFVMIIPVNNSSNQYRLLKEQVVEKARGIKNLQIIDFVPFNEIMEYFQRAVMFVNTSVSEGFPNTFIQAAAARTPILSFNINPDQMITQYEMGFYCGDDMELAVKYLQEFDEDKRQKLGENAFRYYRENHNLSESAAKYKRLIKSLL